MTAAPAPLDGIRVVDLTRFVSGSYAAQLMAAMGAEVIKIEVPPNGDPYRSQGTVRVEGHSVLFMTLNTGKKSVALDFRAAEAAPHMERLLASADVLLENARPGTLDRYRLDYTTVHDRHPHLVYGSVSGFGDVGPDAGRGGFDLILQAESGLMSVTGHPDTGPAKVGAPVTDVGAGLACVAAINAALFERSRTGSGRHVSTSLLEVALSSLSTMATAAFVTEDPPGLLGTHSSNFAPYGAFRVADGWIVLAGAGSDELWVRLCDALDLSPLVEEPRFADNASRVANRSQLTRVIEERTSERSASHWLEVLEKRGVPAARIANLTAAFSTEQVRALGMVEEAGTPSGQNFTSVATPIRFDGDRLRPPSPAPRLGGDTKDVLTDLGATEGELQSLVEKGIAII